MRRTGDRTHPGVEPRPGRRADSGPGRSRTYGLLAGLSVVQFTAFAFFSFGLIAILRQRGVPLARLGLIQFTLVIPALRFLWAPLVDRSARCRTWLVVLLPVLAAVALALSAVQPESRLGATLALVVTVTVLGATINIAADALTVRLLDETGRGPGNGLRVAGGYAGTLISGGPLLVIYDRFGWSPTLCTVAVLAMLPVAGLIGFREPAAGTRVPDPAVSSGPAAVGAREPSSGTRDALPAAARGFADVVGVLRRPGAGRWALCVLPVYWTGVYAAAVLVDPMLVDAGWSLSRIALVVNTPAELVALGAGLVGGLLLARAGRRRALLLGGLAQVVAVAAVLPLAFGIAPAVPTSLAVCAVKAGYAIAATVVTTVSMSFCRPESAGTDVAVLAAVGSAVTAAASAAVLPAAGVAGYPATVGGCVALAAAATVIARRFGPPDPNPRSIAPGGGSDDEVAHTVAG